MSLSSEAKTVWSLYYRDSIALFIQRLRQNLWADNNELFASAINKVLCILIFKKILDNRSNCNYRNLNQLLVFQEHEFFLTNIITGQPVKYVCPDWAILVENHQMCFVHQQTISEQFCSSQPSMVHWLSSPIFPCSFVGCPAMVTLVQISLLVAPHPKTHTFSESLW